MNTLLISYDLNHQKNYDEVIHYIKSLGDWAKPLKSQWLVKTSLEPLDVIHGLKLHGADGDDSLLVINVTKDHAAWSRITTEVSDWMKINL